MGVSRPPWRGYRGRVTEGVGSVKFGIFVFSFRVLGLVLPRARIAVSNDRVWVSCSRRHCEMEENHRNKSLYILNVIKLFLDSEL